MRKYILLGIALVLAVTVLGCIKNSSGTAYIAGYDITYKVDEDFTTFIVVGSPLPAATMTFEVDGYNNITMISHGTTEFRNGITLYGLDYIRFMIWPDKYAVTTYADTYFYGGCMVMSYNGWNLKCDHPIVIMEKTITPTHWSMYAVWS